MAKINGKPLIYYTIINAKKSKKINQIYISSDGNNILNYAKKLEEVINISGLSKTINNLSKKIHTIVGHKAKKLSGGQMQRISLARALYRDSQVLIFDEPTSSLDEKMELEILKNLMSSKNKTIIIIAHKFAKYKFRFNKIISLD